MDSEQPVAVLEELLAAKGEHLLRTAVLLASSHADGEDLLQAALEQAFRRWRTIRGDPEGYLRRTLYHLAADGWRRKGAWRARLGLLHQPEALSGGIDDVDRRDRLLRLLRELPPRQRTAMVLRHWEELTEAEAAQARGCSAGTVKSATSRGLGGDDRVRGRPRQQRARRVRGDRVRVRAHHGGRAPWPPLAVPDAGRQPNVAWATTMTSNGYVYQLGVNYQARTYTRQSWKSAMSGTAPSGICARSKYQNIDAGDLTSDPRAQIEAGLRCGVFTLAGHQRIDGIDALKLVNQEPRSGGTQWMTLTLWVDPATYLPIETQLDTHGHLGGPAAHSTKGGIVPGIRYITVTFTWLAPTRANLALLTPPIPAGFRQVTGEP